MFSKRTHWDTRLNRFTQAQVDLKDRGVKLIDLTVSNPTACGIQYDEERILNALGRPDCLTYEPEPKGILSARCAVSDYYAALADPVSLPAENIFLTTSTSEGYSFCFRLLCDAGDEVLVPQPGYPLFDLLADIQDVRLVPYDLVYDHAWQVDLNSVRAAISPRTRAVVVVNPSNPAGSFLKAGEMRELKSICMKHDLAMISDEVFLDYSFDPLSRVSTLAGNHETLSFTLSGLSKIAGLPQMKLSWIAVSGPKELLQDAVSRLELISDTYLSVSAPIQHALPELLDSRNNFHRQLMARLGSNLNTLDSQLSAQKSCVRLQVEGGWYVTLRVPVTRSDEELAIALMNHAGVLVHPGHFFDFREEGRLVLSLMTPENDFAEGVSRILAYIASSS